MTAARAGKSRVIEVVPIRRDVPLPRHLARPPVSFWLTAAGATTLWCAAPAALDAADARRTTTGLLSALALFYGLAPVMALALAVVGLLPALLLAPLALSFRAVTGRPSGFGPLLRDLTAPARRLVPGYVHALRGVRSPLVWGVLLGSTLAAPILLVTGPAG